MNTSRLAKLYDALSPAERLPLVVAACHRGDEAECRRLIDTAPTCGLEVSHHYLHARALERLTFGYLARQLELLAGYWHGLGPAAGKADVPAYVGVLAYLFCANADAWELFCRRLGVEPAAVLAGLTGAELIESQGPLVRLLTAGRSDVGAFYRQQGRDTDHVPTAADLADLMHRTYQANVGPDANELDGDR